MNDQLISGDLTIKQVNHYSDAFRFFDQDGDGKITKAKLGRLLMSLGQNPSAEELEDLINEADAKLTGYIEFDQFLRFMVNKVKAETEEDEYMAAFDVFDSDSDGLISLHEIRLVLNNVLGEKLAESDILEIIKKSKIDGKRNINEHIDRNQFMRIMTGK